MRDLRGADGGVARPRREPAARASRTHARTARVRRDRTLRVHPLRRRQHAQYPRPLSRARSTPRRLLWTRAQAHDAARVTDHVLTIDLGTSGPKVALFTIDGAFVDGDFTPVELQLLPD